MYLCSLNNITMTTDHGKKIKMYLSNMYYCVHKPTKSLVSREASGGHHFHNNPNDMTFMIEGAWEDSLKYRNDKSDFEVIKFTI